MNRDQHRTARATCVALMQAGQSWQQAVAASGLPIGRSAAYALVQRVKKDGDAALVERRCGHAHKLRPPIRDWIVTTCQADPHIPSHRLQPMITAQFAVTISISQINGVRAVLGVRYHRPKKTLR